MVRVDVDFLEGQGLGELGSIPAWSKLSVVGARTARETVPGPEFDRPQCGLLRLDNVAEWGGCSAAGEDFLSQEVFR